MTLSEIMDLADAHAKAYYMGRGEDTRKELRAAILEMLEDAAVIVENAAYGEDPYCCVPLAKEAAVAIRALKGPAT